MAVYKQSGSRYWWTCVYVPGSAKGGRSRRYIRQSTGTEEKAKAEAIEQTIKLAMRRTAPAEHLHALIDALSGTDRPEKIPLGGMWAEFSRLWAVGGRRIAERTMTTRQRIVERLCTWIELAQPNARNVEDVDRRTATAFAAALAKSGAKGKTRRNIIAELSAVWSVLGAVHGIANPWQGITLETADSEVGKAFSRAQEAALIAAADAAGHDWGVMCRVARFSGLRYGDVARLTDANVDAENMALRIQPSKTARHGIAVVLPLPAEVFALLRRDPGPLFPEAFGCLPRQMWRHPFARVLDAAGLAGKGFTFHSWRHTFRTRLSEAGVGDDIAKRLGGWTQDKTAMRYDHAERIAEMRAAVEATR